MNEVFEAERGRLTRLAYTMLGSMAEAEEVVQEAWLRANKAEGVRSPAAWLTTVVSRLALDELRSARARREVYPGPWLPEPIRTDTPEDATSLAEAVQLATLVVLEQLTPAERAAFLLREVFDMDYRDLAGILDRSEPAVRQLVRRSKQALAERKRVPSSDDSAVSTVLARLSMAVQTGDLAGVQAALATDCVFVSDGGGVVSAATRVVTGPERVSKLMVGLARKFGADVTFTFVTLNHQPGVLMFESDVLTGATVFTVVDGRVSQVLQIRNPAKLTRLGH